MAGQLIETTAEHPFWVVGRGWTPVWELSKGDSLTTMSGETISVEGVHETARWETVYNFRVNEFHTYFVGCDEWGFSVWAHNANCVIITEAGGQHSLIDVVTGKTLKTGTQAEVQAFATSGGHTILPGTTTTPAAGYAGYAPRPATVSATFDAEAALPGPLGTNPVGARATGSRQTTGVAVWTDGNGRQSMTLTSGNGNAITPPGAYSGPNRIPGMTSQNYHHPEGQMASFMRENPHIREAEMWINHPTGPCGAGVQGSMGCNPNLNQTLLPGQRLTVRWRDASGKVQFAVFENPALP
ncbi:polymorphic toxin-type HINT domain-containing protein [Tuwongella immobilis]|uniref:Intein C-terminal splicing domain-containing protein n=1 Tax=Tuwongella immobilis TaxID=692036 RepID=A0A6C2YH96_9BACT|nr:polymorphic toxin-type HINT domain-containing protein [Tuwongella immobilis]VIP00787.1 YD repeat protein OS=Isosphaera pallida (strain ATCC 43644 / DSM 9630 / IS1B) GN=Isop_2419 PE=4 SV=1: PT-HINT: SCP1201-deam [Tuwongella immobilis]VTR96992.1 YD repeat protein OS=Isosphaera pallida (strain ATCC 43644 / DSM 9630 / IS1B) GN=Isop_2419 PE=4 SV=1: PT-HINT: SCP1201-deam [Tuwongella immobilis]